MRALVSILVLAIVILTANRSEAITYVNEHGTSCVWYYTSAVPESYVAYDPIGISSSYSYTSYSMQVVCPVNWRDNSSPNPGGFIQYEDLSSDPSSGGSLVCNAVGEDLSGNLFYGPSRWSCSSTYGCTSPSPSYMTPPGTQSVLLVIGAGGFGGGSAWSSYSFHCSIPAIYASGPSRIVTYQTAF